MRGKAEVMQTMTDLSRITPAYAGKSGTKSISNSSWWDHPRLCGEKYRKTDYFQTNKGITPAYAGKRLSQIQIGDIVTDHPRLCGEKFRLYSGEKLVLGSPPPMRGKDLTISGRSIESRITPAYAGKSVWYYPTRAATQDHPRLCGEKAQLRHKCGTI